MSSGKESPNAKLLLEFGQFAGLSDLRFDEDSVCILSFDETAVFLKSEDDGALTIYSPLAEVPEEKKSGIQSLLLDANFLFQATQGATLCMAGHSSFVTIAIRLKPSFLNLKLLVEAMEEFIQIVDFWRKKLSSLIREADRLPAEEAKKERHPPLHQRLKA